MSSPTKRHVTFTLDGAPCPLGAVCATCAASMTTGVTDELYRFRLPKERKLR
jgi:hypothetical protein